MVKHPAGYTLARSLAIVLAVVGAMLFAAPQGAQAAPTIVSAGVAGSPAGLTEVRWKHKHFRHHHHRRHFGHYRGRHYGHYRHHRHHRFHRHHGRRFRF
jgi:hypothetical protein